MTSASRSRRRNPAERLRGRLAFAVPLLIFLVIGITLVGDFSAQWWLLIVPFLLLLDPVLAVRREARRQPGGDQQRIPRG